MLQYKKWDERKIDGEVLLYFPTPLARCLAKIVNRYSNCPIDISLETDISRVATVRESFL